MEDKKLSQLIGYPVDIRRFSKSDEKKIKLALEDGKGRIWIKVPMSVSQAVIEEVLLSLKNILPPLFNIFLPEEKDKCTRWIDFDSLTSNELENQYEPKVDRRELPQIILRNKGLYHTNEEFVCAMCSRNHTKCYSYYINDKEIKICKYCHDDIHNTKPWTKLILINAGGSR